MSKLSGYFVALANKPSRLDKQDTLRNIYKLEGSKVTRILLYCYDPFRRYKMQKGFAEGKGTQEIDDTFFDILDRMADGRFSGLAAQRAVNVYLHQLTAEDAELAVKVIKKDLRIGMAIETINQVFPGLIPVHKVMLAKPIEWHRVKYPCWATIKLDGVRAIYRSGKFYFRNGKEIVGLASLADLLIDAPVLDGELVCPGLTFQESSGKIRAYAPTDDVEFHIIDVPEHPSIEFNDRMTSILCLIGPRIHQLEGHFMHDRQQIEKFYNAILEQGYEGLVIKPTHYAYQNKRSYAWMKMKVTDTIDAKVISMFEGEGKYFNQMGGVIIDVDGVQVKVGSGFTDAERYVFWRSPEKILDHVIEVHYHEKTPDGSLRHPRFKQVRLDK